jgi:hypothetical protein
VVRQNVDQEARQRQGAPGRSGLRLLDVAKAVAGALERADDAHARCPEIEVGPLETGKPPPEAKI